VYWRQHHPQTVAPLPYTTLFRSLGRSTAHRTAMLRGLVTFFLENGKIETTATRAKEVRSLAEKMITIAKDNSLQNKRLVMSFIRSEEHTSELQSRYELVCRLLLA